MDLDLAPPLTPALLADHPGWLRPLARHLLSDPAGASPWTPPSPRRRTGASDLRERLGDLVLSLPDNLRELVLCHYVDGLSVIEIGHKLEISAASVRWHLALARDCLRRLLAASDPAWERTLREAARPTTVTVAGRVVAIGAAAVALARFL